jgi:ATP-dependent DNA helicase RecD-like protein
LNIELQAGFNPAGDRKVERFGWTFAPGDKVMQIENDCDKEVYNGDIGYIDDVAPNAGEIVASFDDRSVTYGFGELDMLVPRVAAAKPSLHRRHSRQAAGRVGRTEKGRRHCGAQRLRPATLVEAGRMAASWSSRLTAQHGGLSLSIPSKLDQPTLIARISAARSSTGIVGSSPELFTGRLRR